MKFLLIFVLVAAAAFAAEESQLLKDFAAGNVQFTADTYKELLKTNSGNFLVCPITVETILALTQTGAKGKTAQQISTSLHLPTNSEDIKQLFQNLIRRLKSSNEYTLNTANKVYVKDGYQVKDTFKSTGVEVFDADVQNIDFTKQEQSAAEMNKWVEEKTHNKIKNLVQGDDLSEDTFAVLINTLYFNGKWMQPFDADLTGNKPFHVNAKEQVEVEMMEVDTFLNYYENEDLKAKYVELPYVGDDVTMTIVLPNEIDGLASLESRIAEAFVKPEYSTEHLVIALPKFKIETTIQFKSILQSMGIVDAFENVADFSGILDSQPLKISEVIQKNYIEVHEEGTEASSAAGGFLHLVSIATSFEVNHPFLFYIKHKDVILFTGRYVGPKV